MRYINLFVSCWEGPLFEELAHVFNTYRDGVFHDVCLVRHLEERLVPHAVLISNHPEIDKDVIIFVIEEPVTMDDMSWLYKMYITDNRTELDKKLLMQYAYDRTRIENMARQKNATEQHWNRAKIFRNSLEPAQRAFRLFKNSALDVNKHTMTIIKDKFIVLEYEARKTKQTPIVSI